MSRSLHHEYLLLTLLFRKKAFSCLDWEDPESSNSLPLDCRRGADRRSSPAWCDHTREEHRG
jgi:hypothetical protein